MYTDQVVIQKNLEINLFNKFGEQISNRILLLTQALSGKDSYIDENLVPKLQNFLSLRSNEASCLAELALELAPVSPIASVLLLEKIPTLTFYDVVEEIGSFLSSIKDYGGRAVALYLGSEQTNTLRVEDLVDVLEQSTLPFYKTLINAVNARHHEFGVCCAMIMRFASKIETAVGLAGINAYLNVCSTIVKQYSAKIAEQFIRHSHQLISFIPLNKILSILDDFSKKSLTYVEFTVTFPEIVFSSTTLPGRILALEKSSVQDIKQIKIQVLQTNDYLTFLENPALFVDKDYLSLMMNWPNLSPTVRSNMLFQLQQDNYKDFILSNSSIEDERNHISAVTNSNWLKSWTYCGEVVDLLFIRKRMRILLQDQANFDTEVKSIIKEHSDIFDRSNSEYGNERVSKMLNTLLMYCINPAAKIELVAMTDFIKGQCSSLRDLLSKTTLVVQTWNRDPWSDYGRSDEFFSCTSLGDYNAGNAPAFLSDLNLSNLDVWSNGSRVGRIRLCLIKDASNKTLLLLDCLDGTERALASQKKFELIMSSILEYARWLGIKEIKINYDVDFNATPKKFIAYASEAFKEDFRIDFISRFLTVSTTRHLIPYPCQTFLESFVKNTGAFVRGVVLQTDTAIDNHWNSHEQK